MNIICDNCNSKFKIPDDKIPKGKTASLLCPKCKSKITLDRAQKPDTAFEETSSDTGVSSFEEKESESYEFDRPFDFAEEEGKTALTCIPDDSIKNKVKSFLESMEYYVTEVKNARDAIKKLRYNNYNLMVVDELFDTSDPDANNILLYLERLHMNVRRDIFLIMLTQRFRTMDNMMTFNKSVNLIINSKNIEEFGKILEHGLTDHDMFYKVYMESLRNTGRI